MLININLNNLNQISYYLNNNIKLKKELNLNVISTNFSFFIKYLLKVIINKYLIKITNI